MLSELVYRLTFFLCAIKKSTETARNAMANDTKFEPKSKNCSSLLAFERRSLMKACNFYARSSYI